MKKGEEKQNQYIVFRVKEELYCISSSHVASMLQLPKDNFIKDENTGKTGYISYRDKVVELFSLREALGVPTSDQEYADFAEMIDMRKEDHIHWVKELERTTKAGEVFTLATDPHQCAFGKWYDQFKGDNHAVTYQLSKIDEPHKRIHQAALDVMTCSQQCDSCTRRECLKSILTRVKEEAMPEVLSLLDETKDIFRTNVYRDMVLILTGVIQIGLVVDEVMSVESLIQADTKASFQFLYDLPLILNIKQRENSPELILELNLQELMNSVKGASDRF